MSIIRPVIFICLVFVIFSCKKKNAESVLGLDVQPANDLLGITVTDSSSIFMHTQRVDSVRTYNDQYKFLGSVQDPVFGQTHASIYANFSIANNLTNVSYGSNPILDSAEIVLRFAGRYAGNLYSGLSYDVYSLNEKIVGGTHYYTNQHFPKTKIASRQTNLQVRNGAICLILPFDTNLGQYILQNTGNLVNNTAFLNAYKGLYITSSNNSNISPLNRGTIIEYDLDDAVSGINLYYHDGNSISAKVKVAQFTFRGSDALRLNHIDHNYYAAAVTNLFQQVIEHDTLKGNANIYINSFGGTRVKVYLPFLKAFSDSQNISISRAELILKVDRSGYNSTFGGPENLALIASDASGTEELVFDQLENTDFIKYNGTYDSTTKQYTFNIARQMQKLITGKISNYGFYLVNALPSTAYVARRDNRLERVVFGGKSNVSYTPSFRVTYIKYPYDK